jgi:ATP-dependent Clp protease ATP-binding subunit ClpA
MTSAAFPVPLDNLISYVRTLHPSGDPLENLADAVQVAARLDEQSDALIGHFVDQARHSGASWSQIGSSMGVSKQAAQKRFVPRTDAGDLLPQGHELFSRFTPRAQAVLSVAERTASAAGDGEVGDRHLAVALLTQPQGLAAVLLRDAGLTEGQITDALGLAPATGDPAVWMPPADIAFDPSGTAALRGTLKAALRLAHNYIGTEHILLGILFANGPAGQTLTSLGVRPDGLEAALTDLLRSHTAPATPPKD